MYQHSYQEKLEKPDFINVGVCECVYVYMHMCAHQGINEPNKIEGPRPYKKEL